ncbi:MAG: NUDIX hydrolase [Candidatus Helarchaeota archaeon]
MHALFQKIKLILKNRKRFVITDSRLKQSAVLLILFIKNDEPYVIFTKRTENLKKHKGEISLPGGGIEEHDMNLLDTAFRETEEELYIDRSKITILGQIDDLFTISKYIITPFVGFIKYPYEFKMNHHEVAEVIEVPLSVFQRTDNFREKIWDYYGSEYPIFYYDYKINNKNYTIWGATGYIMNNFIEIIFGFNPSSTKYKRRNPNVIFNKKKKSKVKK